MAGVWLRICGLPPQTTKSEVIKLALGQAITVEIQDISTQECAGRFLVDTMETAKKVLQRANYGMMRGSLVKIGLSAEDLARCHAVAVKNFGWKTVSVKKLFVFSKAHGTVCNISVEEGLANVWFFEEKEAQSFIDGLGRGNVCEGDPIAVLESRDLLVEGTRPTGVIVVDDSDEEMAADTLVASSTSGSATGLDEKHNMLPPGESSADSRTKGPAPAPRHFAHKSLALKNRHKARRLSSSSGESASNDVSPAPQVVPTLPPAPAYAPTGRSLARNTVRPPEDVLTGRSSIRSAVQRPARPTGDKEPSTTIGHLDIGHWQVQAPYMYEYVYCQTASTIAADTESKAEHMLSIAWSKSKSADSSTMSLYSSLGNSRARDTVSNWSLSHSSPRDDYSCEGDVSMIAKSQFALPPRGSMAHDSSTLAAFNGVPAGVVQNRQGKDEFQVPVTAFKMHDSGNILFGCALRSVLVFDANTLKRKGTLVLLDNIDGVYDVGRDYVVANAYNGGIGVWRSGSRNHMWRYNDMRRFKGRAEHKPLITALRVARSDAGVYAGDSGKGLSYCDFRERYIDRLSSPHSGVISCIEDAGGSKILVGTFEGDLRLLDTRFMKEANTSAICSYATGLDSAGIGNIRMCPQNENMFACSAGSDVLIYHKEVPAGEKALLFSHKAHRTLVTDFGWHPSRNNMYTIGSVDIGTRYCPGELHIWRPVNDVLYRDAGMAL
ncbi:hypothetical protein H4218_005143 [Coemansia sp. IMI 209128]|nr:hypothetical protein H4218_005143 [Coemansia sp. IMI 209128]